MVNTAMTQSEDIVVSAIGAPNASARAPISSFPGGPGADTDDDAAHCAAAHLAASGGKDDGALHYAEGGLADAGTDEEAEGELEDGGIRENEEGDRLDDRSEREDHAVADLTTN